MLLHIGNDVMIPLSDIVLILDVNTCVKNKANQAFIEKAMAEAGQRGETDPGCKSLVVLKSGGRTVLHCSPISSTTLKKRAENYLSDYTLA